MSPSVPPRLSQRPPSSPGSPSLGAPSQPPLEPPPPQASHLTRFGSAVGAALVASALASGPAAMRVGGAVEAHGVWPALVAITLLPMILAVLTLRQARVGLRAFALADARKQTWSLAIWVGAFSFIVL